MKKKKIATSKYTHSECKHSTNYYNLNWENKLIMGECGNPDKRPNIKFLLNGESCLNFENKNN